MGKKFYAVKQGRKIGVFDSWEACNKQVHEFPHAVYRSFKTEAEAVSFVYDSSPPKKAPQGAQPAALVQNPSTSKKPGQCPKRASVGSPPRKRKPSPTVEVSTKSKSQAKRRKLASEPQDDYEESPSDLEAYVEAAERAESIMPSNRGASSVDLTPMNSKLKQRGSSPAQVLEVFTDGSCQGNGKKRARAGIGVWYGQGDPRNISERLPGSLQTNNRAEILAVVRAIENAPPGCKLIIHSDSKYMKNGIETWMRGWKKNGWKTKTKTPVLNQDLWMRLDELRSTYDGKIQFEYVMAHSGIEGNEGADYLANRGAEMPLVKDAEARHTRLL